MNKLEQIEHLKKSIKTGVKNEVESMIQSINTSEVFEYHLSDDYENGVYNKLSETEINDILSEIENQLILKIELKFNSNDTSEPSQW